MLVRRSSTDWKGQEAVNFVFQIDPLLLAKQMIFQIKDRVLLVTYNLSPYWYLIDHLLHGYCPIGT